MFDELEVNLLETIEHKLTGYFQLIQRYCGIMDDLNILLSADYWNGSPSDLDLVHHDTIMKLKRRIDILRKVNDDLAYQKALIHDQCFRKVWT